MHRERTYWYEDEITEQEYEVLLWQDTTTDRHYGADLDGNRGIVATFVDDEGWDFVDDNVPKAVIKRFEELYTTGKLTIEYDKMYEWED